MSVQCSRRDTVPAGYLSFRDGLNALIEVKTSGWFLAVDQLSEEQIEEGRDEEGREQYNALVQELSSAIEDGLLDPWAWNRKTNEFLRLSTEVFSLQQSD